MLLFFLTQGHKNIFLCSQETEMVSLSGYRKLPEADVALFGFLSFWVACDPYVFLFYVPMSLCPYKAPACKSVFCSYVFKMTKEECVPMSLCPYNTLVCKSVFLFLCLKNICIKTRPPVFCICL